MIIGICGGAGAGKDTIAARLAETHGFERIAFADPLYQMLEVLTGLPEERLRDRAEKEAVIEWLGKSPRQLLQSLGTEWGRQHVADDVWVRLAVRKAAAAPLVAIPDVRFDNEAQAIKDAGGLVWCVVRPGVTCLDPSTSKHSSERGISPSLIDLVLRNDSDIERFCARVDAAVAKATAAYNGTMHAS